MRRVGVRVSQRRRALAGAVAVPALALLVVLAPARAASAHAIVETVSPPDGSTMETAPSQVVVRFSEAILADNLSVSVRSSAAADQPAAAATAHLDGADASRVVVDLGPLSRGTYQIRLTAHDRVDLHEVVATTSFAVGEAPPPPSPPVIAGPEPFEAAARWLSAIGLALVVGALAVRWAGPGLALERPRRLRTLVTAGAAASMVGRLGVLAARIVTLDTSRVQALWTTVNTADAQRFALVVGAAALLGVGERQLSRAGVEPGTAAGGAAAAGRRKAELLARRSTAGWMGAATLVWVAAWSGHSDLGSGRNYLVPVAKAGHLLGLSLWIGVIVAALAATATAGSRRRVLRTLSPVALFGAGLTVVSGLLLASRLIVSTTALLSTPYGSALVVKVALAAGAMVCGWLVARGHRVGLSTLELGLLGVVVLAGSAMATATPAIDPSFLPERRADLRLAPTAAADDLLIQVRAIPGHPGINTLEVRVASTRRPNPGPVTDVVLTIAGTEVVARPDAAGLALVPDVTLPAGPVEIRMLAHRLDWSDGVSSLSLPVEPPLYVHPVRISSAPLRRPLLGAAVVGTLAGAALLRRRRRTAPPADPAAGRPSRGRAETPAPAPDSRAPASGSAPAPANRVGAGSATGH